MVPHDVQHDLQLAGVHGTGKAGEIQARAGQMFVERVEVDAPIAVIAGLAMVAERAAAGDRLAAGKRFVGVVDDRGDPHRPEAQVADVIGMLDDALEVATEIADVVLAAVGAWCGHIEGAMRTALIAMVVAGIAVDEAVGHHEVHRLGGERLRVP